MNDRCGMSSCLVAMSGITSKGHFWCHISRSFDLRSYFILFFFFFFSLIMWSLKSLVQRCCLYRSIKFLIRSGDLAQLQPQLRLPLNLDHPRYCSPFHHSVVTCGPPLIQSQGAEVDSFVYWHDECLHGTIASGMRGIISTASSLSLLCFRIATELLVCRGQK